MEMNSKVVPSPGHCFANLFLHGITKQPVHCIGLSHSPGPLKSVLILGCGHFCLPDFGCETFLVCAGLVLADTSQIVSVLNMLSAGDVVL